MSSSALFGASLLPSSGGIFGTSRIKRVAPHASWGTNGRAFGSGGLRGPLFEQDS